MRARFTLPALAAVLGLAAAQEFVDRTHGSRVFGQPRRYRLFLPEDYDSGQRRYPVIYYFHGHSDRYTLELYDGGKDTAPRISTFAARNGVIVVAVDGYAAEHYTGFYNGTPWDVMRDGGRYDFGEYFLELASHIDSTLRTIPERRSRATAGLSMGGFMSLFLAARYPDLIGSASAFNPGPEFYAGEPGRRVLWRPKDHTLNLGGTRVRLVRASGDYISQYHEETRAAFAAAPGVDFEFRQDEYHRHWATSIEETFQFHMKSFQTPELNNTPVEWTYASPYRTFDVRGYKVSTDAAQPGYTILTGAGMGGFRITTRRWAPDGPAIPESRITVMTAPLYRAGAAYTVVSSPLGAGTLERRQVVASAEGALTIQVSGAGRQIAIQGEGTGSEPPVLLPLTRRDVLRVKPAAEVKLPLKIFNPRPVALENVKLSIESEYPQVSPQTLAVEIPKLAPAETVDLSKQCGIRVTTGAGDFTRIRFVVKITYDGWHTVERYFDVMAAPEVLPPPDAVELLDGRTFTFDVFRQKGNQGGGGIVKRTVTEGKGNGNGMLEPGEQATVWVRMRQGMDAYDKNTWHRARIYFDSDALEEVDIIEEDKQREWTGAKDRTSLIELRAAAASLPVILSNESWSFAFTPDVRYGKERLYQAFQLHTTHLHQFDLRRGK
ncbi:MAG: hypothetical protein IT161_06500 [Bryobacterales bacterium]|nr:hypothetical protein [Bryobacterales bacterium]